MMQDTIYEHSPIQSIDAGYATAFFTGRIAEVVISRLYEMLIMPYRGIGSVIVGMIENKVCILILSEETVSPQI